MADPVADSIRKHAIGLQLALCLCILIHRRYEVVRTNLQELLFGFVVGALKCYQSF